MSSCLSVPEPVCQSTQLVPIVSASGPKTVAVGQPATFNLSYLLGSSCGTFNNFATATNAAGTTQQVGVSVSFSGCSCTEVTTPVQTVYQFQAAKAGTYYLQFVAANSTFIVDTLVVQ